MTRLKPENVPRFVLVNCYAICRRTRERAEAVAINIRCGRKELPHQNSYIPVVHHPSNAVLQPVAVINHCGPPLWHSQQERVDPHRGARVNRRGAELDHRIAILVGDTAAKNLGAPPIPTMRADVLFLSPAQYPRRWD